MPTPGDEAGFVLTLNGQTKVPAKIEKTKDGGVSFTAPETVFKLAPIETLAASLIGAISAQTRLDQKRFTLRVGISIDQYSMCHPFAQVSSALVLAEGQAEMAIVSLLRGLKPGDNRTGDLLASGGITLSDDAKVEIGNSVTAILGATGGSPISTPLNLFIGSRQVGCFRGMYGPKPDFSQNTPIVVVVTGKCDGFRLKRRCLFIEADGSSLQAFWETDDQRDEVFRLASDPTSVYEIELKKTIDRAGNPLYTYSTTVSCKRPR